MAEMKTRKKTEVEEAYDLSQCDEAKADLCSAAEEFISEFQECEGNVYYSTFTKASRALWDLEHARRVQKCTKVGNEWDFESSITGKYRYPHLR